MAETSAGARLESVPCNLCGGTSFRPIYRDCRQVLGGPGRFDVVACLSCSLVQTRPRPVAEDMHRYYSSDYHVGAVGTPRRRPLAWVRSLCKVPYRLRHSVEPDYPAPPRTGSRLLDVGAGAGDYMAHMARRGWEVWGLEPSPSLARMACAHPAIPPGRVATRRIEDASYEDSSFDTVSMSHSLEHLHDPRAALVHIRRWLRPNGLLRVWVPNFASWERRLFGRHWVALDLPRHLFHFTPQTISLILSDTGYAVDRMVPQFQGSSLSCSMELGLRSFLRHEGPYSRGPIYYAALPAAWILTAIGSGSAIEVSARPR